MTDSAGKLAEADASVVWQQLSDQIDALSAAWERGEPPALVGLFAGRRRAAAAVDAAGSDQSRLGVPLA